MPSKLNADYIRTRLRYNPDTGDFHWFPKLGFDRETRRWNTRHAGKLAGSKTTPHGYWRILLDYEEYSCHQLAWVWMTGEWPYPEVDHKNHIPSDNRWANLRLATESQNQWNRRASRNNKLGVKGVSRTKYGRYRAQIQAFGIERKIGIFATLEEASAAYDKAAMELHGEFACVEGLGSAEPVRLVKQAPKSGEKGVAVARNGNFQAYTDIGRKRIHLGTFTTAEKAGHARYEFIKNRTIEALLSAE